MGSSAYGVELTDEAALTAPYGGIAFNDCNESGDALFGLFLRGDTFHIANAYQKDVSGDELPGSLFDPATGWLQFTAPVQQGDFFFVGVDVDSFPGGGGLTAVYACSYASCCAAAGSYGHGFPGTNGVPLLQANEPRLCATCVLEIGNSSGQQTIAVLFAGASDATLPTAFVGQLLLLPQLIVSIGLSAGGVSIPAQVPCDASLCGARVYLQVLERDVGAARGVSFSRGLVLSLGH